MEVGGELRCPGHYNLEDNVQIGNGGWVCLKAYLNHKKKRNLSCPYRKSNPNSSIVHTVKQYLYQLM